MGEKRPYDHRGPYGPKNPAASPLIQLLIERRLDLRLTHREVCDRMGVAMPTFSNWENGKKSPLLSNVEAWAKALGMELTATESEPFNE